MLECTLPPRYIPDHLLCLESQIPSVRFILSKELIVALSLWSISLLGKKSGALKWLLWQPSKLSWCLWAATQCVLLMFSSLEGWDPDCLSLISPSVDSWGLFPQNSNFCFSCMGYISCASSLFLPFPCIFRWIEKIGALCPGHFFKHRFQVYFIHYHALWQSLGLWNRFSVRAQSNIWQTHSQLLFSEV